MPFPQNVDGPTSLAHQSVSPMMSALPRLLAMIFVLLMLTALPTTAMASDCDNYAGCSGSQCDWSISRGYYCSYCSGGKYLNGDFCLWAPAGYYATGSKVYECPVGKYQPYVGRSSCYSAPAGTYVPYQRSTNYTSCSKGTWQNLTGQSSCKSASPGYYVPDSKSTTQTACAAGTYQPNSKSTSCIQADKGHFVSSSGSTTQNACSKGYWQDQTGQSSCKRAAAGWYVDRTGATSQKPCLAGTYSTGTATSCTLARAGRYVPTDRATRETVCGYGKWQDLRGQTSCKLADAGHMVPTVTGISQTPCSAGNWQNQRGQRSCKPAAKGHYVPGSKAISQTACDKGSYQPSTGQSSCTPAASGYFVDTTAAVSQTACSQCGTAQFEESACVSTADRACGDCDNSCLQCDAGGDMYCTVTAWHGFLNGFEPSGSPALLHRWSFTSDSTDSIGNADATLVNGASVSAGTVSLDGVDQYLSLPIEDTLSQLTSFTVEMWVRVDNPELYWVRLFDFGSSWDINVFMTSRGGTGVLRTAITTTGNAGEEQLNSVSPFPPGTMTHVALTLDAEGQTATLYVNGNLRGSEVWTMTPAALGPLPEAWLGRSHYPDPFLAGSYDEVRIYSGALSAEAVRQSFTRGPDG